MFISKVRTSIEYVEIIAYSTYTGSFSANLTAIVSIFSHEVVHDIFDCIGMLPGHNLY